MKKEINKIVLSIILGALISLVQDIVIHGLPLHFHENILGEILFSACYVYCFFWMTRFLMRGFFAKTIRGENGKTEVLFNFIKAELIGLVMLFLIGILLTVIIKGTFDIKLKELSEFRFIMVYYFFINAILFSVEVGLRVYRLYSHEKDAKHQAEQSFMQAQLQMLRQQLNPHFLFNNLNIIAATINANPKLAHDFTKSMADFYRKVLETERSGWITLKEELKTVRSYLYMLSVRFEDKINYEISIPEDIQMNYLVPDFILQPIIENIIKHNHCSKQEPLRIFIGLNDTMRLVISNNHNPKNVEAESLGIGWFNIQSRYKYLGAETPVKYILGKTFFVEISMIKQS
ncbi:MAG: histidine kinase [Chitinophagaceae bacterium]|nr:histidine kinase [Chitinophagaceae bacterium]